MPSRDCLETPQGLRYGVLQDCQTGRMSTFSGAWRNQKRRDPTRTATFQTVSLGSRVNKGKRAKGRPLRPALVALSGGRPPIYRLVLVRHAVLALHHFAVERPRGAEEGRIRKAVVDGRCLAV